MIENLCVAECPHCHAKKKSNHSDQWLKKHLRAWCPFRALWLSSVTGTHRYSTDFFTALVIVSQLLLHAVEAANAPEELPVVSEPKSGCEPNDGDVIEHYATEDQEIGDQLR